MSRLRRKLPAAPVFLLFLDLCMPPRAASYYQHSRVLQPTKCLEYRPMLCQRLLPVSWRLRDGRRKCSRGWGGGTRLQLDQGWTAAAGGRGGVEEDTEFYEDRGTMSEGSSVEAYLNSLSPYTRARSKVWDAEASRGASEANAAVKFADISEDAAKTKDEEEVVVEKRLLEESDAFYTQDVGDSSFQSANEMFVGDSGYGARADLMSIKVRPRGEDYWTTNLRTMFQSRVFRRILPHLTVNMLVSSGVSLLYLVLPSLPCLPGVIHGVTGSFLGLLIAFRAQTGYERYWEARKAWGDVHKRCRSLARLIIVNLAPQRRFLPMVTRVLQILTAYPYALKQHLRGEYSLTELSNFLTAEDLKALPEASNMPLQLCFALSLAVRPLLLESGGSQQRSLWSYLDLHIQELSSAIARSERLATTPVPLSYSRHTSRFLSVWTLTLPFFLVSYCGPLMAMVAHFFICWALLGTEMVGHMIEEPFGTRLNFPPPRVSAFGRNKTSPSNGRAEEAMREPSETLPLLRYSIAIRKDIEYLADLYSIGLKVALKPAEEVDQQLESDDIVM